MIAYGYPIKEEDDPYVRSVEEAVQGFSESLEPGAFLVDVIPLRGSRFFLFSDAANANCSSLSHTLQTVRHVPDWFPGTGWKAKGKQFAELLDEMADIPYQYVKKQMVSRWP